MKGEALRRTPSREALHMREEALRSYALHAVLPIMSASTFLIWARCLQAVQHCRRQLGTGLSAGVGLTVGLGVGDGVGLGVGDSLHPGAGGR